MKFNFGNEPFKCKVPVSTSDPRDTPSHYPVYSDSILIIIQYSLYCMCLNFKSYVIQEILKYFFMVGVNHKNFLHKLFACLFVCGNQEMQV